MVILIHEKLGHRICEEIAKAVIYPAIGYMLAIGGCGQKQEEEVIDPVVQGLGQSQNYSVMYKMEGGRAFPYVTYDLASFAVKPEELEKQSIDKLVRRNLE